MANRDLLTVAEIMTILPETPGRIAALTDGLTEAQLRLTPDPDGWSINDNLAHLRACHDVLGGSILRILTEDTPTWRHMSPRTWMRRTDYRDQGFASSVAAFVVQRAVLLTALQPRPVRDWERTAIVTGLSGGTAERSVRFYGDWLAGHERTHLTQIDETARILRSAT